LSAASDNGERAANVFDPDRETPAAQAGRERIASANGIEIAYDEIGDPDGTPLLLVMGLACQLIHWDAGFCGLLAERGNRIIRFDNRDIGHSTKIDGAPVPGPEMLVGGGSPAYRLSDMAADTAGLLDHLGIERAHIVGASMGGMISQTIAIEHPERVASLCSIMSTTGAPGVGSARPAAIGSLTTPPVPTREGYADAAVRISRVLGSPDYPADEERMRDLGRRAFDRGHYPEGVARQLHAITSSPDRTERLRHLDVPALVLHGSEDPLIALSGGEATAQAIPGARLKVFAGMGHDLPPALWRPFVEEIDANLNAAQPA
jgi:pimeloyl-ACP methyl ester carboxylesterase